MVVFNIHEGKGVIAAIVKENGTVKNLQQPDDTAIVYATGGVLVAGVFLEAATSYGQDSSKSVNKTDLVGTQNQKISEGSIQDTFTYDALALDPAALNDTTIKQSTGTVHGLNAATNAQYLVTSVGLRKMLRSSNTYTVRLFIGCALDANNDADISTASEVYDLERTHIESHNTSASGGGDVTVSVTFSAETISFPAAWNTQPV
jgi:hypothetical protein